MYIETWIFTFSNPPLFLRLSGTLQTSRNSVWERSVDYSRDAPCGPGIPGLEVWSHGITERIPSHRLPVFSGQALVGACGVDGGPFVIPRMKPALLWIVDAPRSPNGIQLHFGRIERRTPLPGGARAVFNCTIEMKHERLLSQVLRRVDDTNCTGLSGLYPLSIP